MNGMNAVVQEAYRSFHFFSSGLKKIFIMNCSPQFQNLSVEKLMTGQPQFLIQWLFFDVVVGSTCYFWVMPSML